MNIFLIAITLQEIETWIRDQFSSVTSIVTLIATALTGLVTLAAAIYIAIAIIKLFIDKKRSGPNDSGTLLQDGIMDILIALIVLAIFGAATYLLLN